jgi:hypothetical protein
MNIRTTRKQSINWIENELSVEYDVLVDGFDLISLSVSELSEYGLDENDIEMSKLFRIGALTLAKSCHFLLGCFSLALDGLSQESGALLRPLIETYELLIYIRLDPTRVDEVTEERLPSAGNIAKKISGNFKGLREHLNEHASHFRYKVASVKHLVDFKSEALINPFPSHDISVLKRNLNTLNAIQTILLLEIVSWLELKSDGSKETIKKIRLFCIRSDTIFPSPPET